jgi:hypothetical protein
MKKMARGKEQLRAAVLSPLSLGPRSPIGANQTPTIFSIFRMRLIFSDRLTFFTLNTESQGFLKLLHDATSQ